MNVKTEDEIAREKDAVQKMIGAKGAMEAALKRIERLEGALSSVNMVLEDMRKKVGQNLYVKTYHHGGASGEAVVSLSAQIEYAQNMILRVK